MILVITGMDRFPFDRVVKAIDELAGAGRITEEIFVQLGSCKYLPRHCRYQQFLSFAEISETIGRASVVITHAGVGSTLNTIRHGKHPIIVPRLAIYGEVVDDHQNHWAQYLQSLGHATMITDMNDLPVVIEAVRGKTQTMEHSGAGRLVAHLETFWRSLAAAESSR